MYEFFYNLGLKAAEVTVPGGMASIGSGRMGGSTLPRTQTGFNSNPVGGSFWNNQQQTGSTRQFSAAGPSGGGQWQTPMALPQQQQPAPAAAAPAAPAAPVAPAAPKAPAAPAAPAAAPAAAPQAPAAPAKSLAGPAVNSAADLAKVAPKGTTWEGAYGQKLNLPAGQTPPDSFFLGQQAAKGTTTARVGVDPNSKDMSPAFANAYAARALAQDPQAFSRQLASGAIPGQSGLRALTDRDYPNRPVGRRAIDQV